MASAGASRTGAIATGAISTRAGRTGTDPAGGSPTGTSPTGTSPTGAGSVGSPTGRRAGARRHRRHVGLRARVTIAFALGALVLSGALASISYFSVRNSVVNDQETSLTHQALGNAVFLSGKLQHVVVDYAALLASLNTGPGSQSLMQYSGQWFTSSLSVTQAQLPARLQQLVLSGTLAQQVITLHGSPQLVVGVPMTTAKAAYFEVFDLSDTERTLRVLLGSLVLAAAVTTLGGAILGSWGASRSLRPLHETAQAALAIAGGRLDTRLEAEDYADLAVLTSAFNRMVDRLQERVEREVRFSADVNHELRSPLTTLTASLSVLEARRDELPERSGRALDLLGAEVRRFRRLVDDLLEISRLDAGLGEVADDEVAIGPLVHNTVNATGIPVQVSMDDEVASRRMLTDKLRFERIVANLLENARNYAGGPTRFVIEATDDGARFTVEDEGPGIPPSERERIFERFARGSSAKRRGAGEGTGLGLAIVSEHARALGGRVFVEPNGERGARFVVELPLRSSNHSADHNGDRP